MSGSEPSSSGILMVVPCRVDQQGKEDEPALKGEECWVIRERTVRE